MKKIVVSDYDGVFKPHNGKKTILDNIESSVALRESNNIFMVATGRIFESMKNEYDSFNIKSDFISCANGNALFDSNWDLIYSNPLENPHLEQIKNYYNSIEELITRDAYCNSSSSKIVEFIIVFKSLEERKKVLKDILSKPLLTYYTERDNKLIVHVYSKTSDKVLAIRKVAQICNIPEDKIFTLGDGDNDKEMIRQFNGFAMSKSSKEAEQYALNKYNSFSDFATDVKNDAIVSRKSR